MNDGVTLLLERMKTHPEEFGGQSRWKNLIESYAQDLEEDYVVLLDAMRKCRRQEFTELVLQELIDPVEENKTKKGNAFTHKFRKALAAQTPIEYTADKIEALGLTPIAGVTQTLWTY